MKFIYCFALFLLFIFSLSPCFAQALEEISLRELEKAALRYSDLESREIQHWKSRVKWAAALPRIVVGYEQKAALQVNNTLQDSVSVTSGGVTVGPPESSLNQDNNFNRGFEAKAYWDLNELVFSKDSLSVASEARYRQMVRNQVLDELQQAFFDRKRLFMQMGNTPSSEWNAGMRIRLEETEAKLDSLTGGRFSQLKGENR